VNELVKLGENNPDLALAVLQGINDALQDVSGNEASRLQTAAVTAAASAAAIGSSLLNNAGKIPESMDQDKLIELVKNSLEGMSNLPAASDILLAIIPDPKRDEKAFDSFINTAKADDLAMASVTLIAAETKKQGGNVKDYIQSLDQSKSLSALESLALKCAEEAVKKMNYDEPSGAIRDILKGLNLI
jgi:predicted regulator of Ras-like GTPase activity (Roadblock/LC7/MglB family)